MARHPVLLFLVPLFAVAVSVAAQESQDEQARRLLEDGRTYRAQGKQKQALDNFNIVVSSFPATDSVGQALLEIGRYRMEVDGDAEKARAAFEQVTKQYARSDAAPGAYYNLGLLTLQRATTPAEIDDALAQFARVETLYPRSPWVPRALQASALAYRRAGRYAEAADLNRRVSLEYPASDAAAAAQFEIGQALALQGQPRLAMEEFQQVRNRFPQSPWAQPALERTTALYRLFGGAKPAFSPDPAFSLAAGDVLKDVRAIAVAPGGVLWIASDKTRSAVPFDTSGKAGPSLTAEEPRSLSLAPAGEIVLAGRTAVRVGPKDVRTFSTPPEKPGAAAKPVDKILAAALTPGGSVLVSDEDREAVLRFDAKGQYLGAFPGKDATKRKVSRILVDGEGAVVTLDREDGAVRVWDETGRLLRTVGPAGLKRPSDVAVDAFRNLYVADEELGILIFNPQGQLLATIASPEMKRPRAVTLDATGAVLVYDDRAERVLRYR
ncbi:MAG TPA: tetratricopeptide repeat protein [Vicinamibacteria bacterium]|nr:tetratricopeptide repeat protein [Vicinamibacteria bacterium]